jgi:protease-4
MWEYLVRDGMSDADREQRQALVDQYYRTMTADVAESREVSQATVDGWIDDISVATAQRALEEGMVDALGTWEDVGDVIEGLEGEKKRRGGARPSRAHSVPSRRWGIMPKIAVVYAIGGCAMDSGIQARQLGGVIRSLSGRRDVRGVVVRVNSPGGSPMASDVVARAIRECAKNKPVIVSQGDVAASGGYYVSIFADEIVAQPTTITGSIGVIGGWVWDDGFGEKVGMQGDMVKAGEHADLFFWLRLPFVGIRVPYRPLTDEERERVLREMGIFYERFVDIVAEARGLDRDDAAEIAKGRVWTGVQGIDNGLVDRIGGLESAIALARERAGYGPGDEVAVVQYGSKGLFDTDWLRPFPLPSFLHRFDDERESSPVELDFLGNYDLVYLLELARNNGRPLCMIPPEFVPRESGFPATE